MRSQPVLFVRSYSKASEKEKAQYLGVKGKKKIFRNGSSPDYMDSTCHRSQTTPRFQNKSSAGM